MEHEAEESGEYGLVTPFWIDTDAYSDRDRLMFVSGYEFAQVAYHLRDVDEEFKTTIHRENESRVRMAAAHFRRKVTMSHCEEKVDPAGTWTYLTIAARPER